MQVVSRDVIWLLSHIRVISSEPPEYARATATSAVDIGAFTLCSQHNRLVTVTVHTPTPMLSYPSPALDRPSRVRPLRQQSRVAVRAKFVMVTGPPIACQYSQYC